ncbi:unnamed protein product [Darwinula stevensoni]|uniref:Uncharacterized protein n=1 Tax=Darwinula stevensoni TaxID=69355 RepID=A0A7R8X4H3_9CRUS|nr:unnamed protein product [Darwinula stevensoni]CAG0879565.1 unnamed protein product [Darwinula stevensoni]
MEDEPHPLAPARDLRLEGRWTCGELLEAVLSSEATSHVSSEEYQVQSRPPQEGSEEEAGGEKGKSFGAPASTPRPHSRRPPSAPHREAKNRNHGVVGRHLKRHDTRRDPHVNQAFTMLLTSSATIACYHPVMP